ncbi:MAG: shikimate dehydrogenase [Anaerolineales bacterium]
MAELNKVGLIGWPADYSVSPAMHNAAFADLGLENWQYELLPTPPNELKERLLHLRAQGYIGANVTVPHKQTIIPLLDGAVLSARGVNAVNTLIIEGGKIEGHNTDVYGIRADLEAHGVVLKDLKALVLGAGGAAHAAVLALANAGADVTVTNRHTQRAWDLYRNIRRGVSSQYRVNVQERTALARIAPNMELVINCTPAGMYPIYTDVSPWPADVPIPSEMMVYDMVYRPLVTRFMQQALDAGATAVGGLGMLVHQGAAAFQLWTGREPSVDIMRAAAEAEIKRSEENDKLDAS